MTDLFFLGRLIFGGVFLYYGIGHFTMATLMAQYAGSKGVPMPEVAVMLSGALLVTGGLSVILGWWPQIGAACIALFLIAVTPVMHNFWDIADPAQRINEMGHFMKNMALLGGTLMTVAVPRPWPYSVARGRRVVA